MRSAPKDPTACSLLRVRIRFLKGERERGRGREGERERERQRERKRAEGLKENKALDHSPASCFISATCR